MCIVKLAVSLTYVRNKTTLRTEPWGTPMLMLFTDRLGIVDRNELIPTRQIT